MAGAFEYDVLLSYSKHDKEVVRDLAERLRSDGLRVWFDEWELVDGDSVAVKIEEGLESSRVLVLCMSAKAIGSEWDQLEAGTFRFRDPLNQDRRFIPLWLDDCDGRMSVMPYAHVDWREKASEEYARLVESCRASAKRRTDPTAAQPAKVMKGHHDKVHSIASSADFSRIATGCADQSVRIWNVNTTQCIRVFYGHQHWVSSVAMLFGDSCVVSCSTDETIRVWSIEQDECIATYQPGAGMLSGISASDDGRRVLVGANDGTVRVWDLEAGEEVAVLRGHRGTVFNVAIAGNGTVGVSAGRDSTVRVWDLTSFTCVGELAGHSDSVRGLSITPDGTFAVSGSRDRTVRLWDLTEMRCAGLFEGHTDVVFGASISDSGQCVVSTSSDNTLRVWSAFSRECLRVHRTGSGLRGIAICGDAHFAATGGEDGTVHLWYLPSARVSQRPLDRAHYTNAKVVLVGDSGAGKTGLSKRLVFNSWQPSDSTVGAWATHWPLPVDSEDGVEREIWLWDFGGQADQRLVHQLFMDETALAVLVFDGQKEDLFETLGQWDRDIGRASRKEFAKLLVAGRVDAGGLRCSPSLVDAFAEERGYPGYLETSAKAGTGCEELKKAILGGIHWESIPWRASPRVFRRLKEEILRLKDDDRVLVRFNELRDRLRLQMDGEAERFGDEELKAVIGLLAGPGAVWELNFGSWVLLQPERINAYAQAVIRTLREDQFERGCIAEEKVLAGDLLYRSSSQRLKEEEERIVLLAMHQTLVERALCLREHTEAGTQLIFPSYYRRERKELTGHPAVHVSYRFHGFLDDVYATLIVRLHHTKSVVNDELWRYAADFRTLTGKQLGVKLTRLGEGAGELKLYFDPAIPPAEKILFCKYVHEHVIQNGRDVKRLRHYVCTHCGTEARYRELAMKRLNDWLAGDRGGDAPSMLCVNCEGRFPLWDDMEECFASPEAKRRVCELQEQSAIVLDNESKERALVGDVISTVALAGQICREKSVSDYGIDMEIEFKNDNDQPTGEMLFLQLKSGDSHLETRKRDGAEVFKIAKQRHADYWREQKFPVFLVIRNSSGEVRWMEIRDYLKDATDNGRKQVRQIVFAGERFDVMNVRRWRDKALGR
jgi:small GTP-binding protein